MKNKNILELCLSPDLGGLELFMGNCYSFFKEKGRCHIAIEKNTKLDKYINNDNAFYLRRNKFFPIIPAKRLANYIDKYNVDIIHFHWTKDMVTVVLAKMLSKKKPQIIQTRNMTMTRFKKDFYHRWLYKNITTMHAVTNQVKDQLNKFIPSDICPNIEALYMGVKEEKKDLKKMAELKKQYQLKDEFIIGIVGRIQEDKGQYLVLEAFYLLKHYNIKLMIVGHAMDNGYLKNLKSKIKLLGIEDKIIFTGFTKEVHAHMNLFDVNILATAKETFGLVVVEAMMSKICTIATNRAGPLEIIEDGKDGLLFDRSSKELAQKIKMLLNNSNLKKELALNGYLKVKDKFEYNKQLNKLYKVINES